MSWARRYALRNIAFSVSTEAADYGTGNYGDSTYGQETSDPLSNVEYVLAAQPGEWPSTAGWVFRVDDIGVTFRAVALGLSGLLDLTPVISAALVIERSSGGPQVVKAFPLVVDDTTNELSYDFVADDLSDKGIYRAAVQLVFNSGRCMTITPDDSSSFLIRGND